MKLPPYIIDKIMTRKRFIKGYMPMEDGRNLPYLRLIVPTLNGLYAQVMTFNYVSYDLARENLEQDMKHFLEQQEVYVSGGIAVIKGTTKLIKDTLKVITKKIVNQRRVSHDTVRFILEGEVA